jgi:membrane dipeptidase
MPSPAPALTYSEDPAAAAALLGVSREAIDLYLASDVIDLHVDSFIWTRVFGYDLTRRHGHGLLGARVYSQVDFPRVRQACITGATWIITTNPLRSSRGRSRAFTANLARLRAIFESVAGEFAVVKNAAEYRAARAAGKHAAFIGVQGGNALDHDRAPLAALDDGTVLRVTLVHLTSSRFGTTSSPLKLGDRNGLTEQGKDFVRRLNQRKVFVDLAHVSPRGFWDAVAVHDRSQPLLVTHTGVSGVHPHWRNLDDRQLRAVADSGGTIGVMYHGEFLDDSPLGGKAESIVRHLEHIVGLLGDDYASLGSDWDGAICTPRDMPTCLELPRLVQIMLDRRWPPDRIQKVLGGNFLRVVAALRG